MAVCYFDDKYDKKYDCQYEVKKDGIEVIVNYDIMDEIQAINGVRTFGSNTEFNERDILIIDYLAKMNYLLKKADCSGHTQVFGTPDGGSRTKFFSNYYFTNSSYEKLCNIPSSNKNIKKIRVYSNMINEFIGYPSLEKQKTDNEYIIKLKKDTIKQKILINTNNINYLEVSDNWISNHIRKDNKIDIRLNGYIEIGLAESISYEEVYDYVYELTMYFQLLKPCKFDINKILVEIEESFHELWLPINEIKYKDSHISNSVKENVLDFLFKCYTTIPYRKSKNEVRNIPYIILNTSRNIEDNFLMFYRFIECYYKQQPIKDIQTTFIKYSIANNYKDKIEGDIENLVQEIICLRNHYVHKGYYIPNKKIYISFPKIEKKANPKNYMVEDIDFEWLYKRTKILYEIVIDIIFRSMLQYDNYEFNKHF